MLPPVLGIAYPLPQGRRVDNVSHVRTLALQLAFYTAGVMRGRMWRTADDLPRSA